MDNKDKFEIADGIYWIGVQNNKAGLKCNPYLIVEKNEAALIDPGSVLDYKFVIENVKKIIPLKKIKYVILHHQDPDLCSCLPMLEQEGFDFIIVTHWRTSVLLKYYGIKPNFYLVDEHNYKLKFKSGRELLFIPAPYLHFPGAITTYDNKTRTLLSGDLFGSMGSNTELYADDDYEEGMVQFHEHYMPSNDIIRPVMEKLLLVNIDRIAPQHGSIINNNIKQYINILRDLECGIFTNPIKRELKESGGYAGVCSLILKRYLSLFNNDDVMEAISGLDITLGEKTYEIIDYNYEGLELWDTLFGVIYKNKGNKWLMMVEPLVQRLSREYGLPLPKIFVSQFALAEQESLILKQEINDLKEENQRINQNVAKTQGAITKCHITGLYNETFFIQYLKNECDAQKHIESHSTALMLISIDDLPRIKLVYGQNEYNNTLKAMAYILKHLQLKNHMLFRFDDSKFAYLITNTKKTELIKIAENIRNEVKVSKLFIEDITISIGVVHSEELKQIKTSDKSISEQLIEASRLRLNIAKGRGGDLIVYDSDINDVEFDEGKVLLVDTDITNTSILKAFLNNNDYNVLIAADGEEAAQITDSELPDLIISEIMIPKLDGFLLKERLSMNSSTKNIPFMILSSLKSDDSVKRAFSLGVEYYLKKPYMMSEILGIVNLKLKEQAK